jgi:hypothetical protein
MVITNLITFVCEFVLIHADLITLIKFWDVLLTCRRHSYRRVSGRYVMLADTVPVRLSNCRKCVYREHGGNKSLWNSGNFRRLCFYLLNLFLVSTIKLLFCDLLPVYKKRDEIIEIIQVKIMALCLCNYF